MFPEEKRALEYLIEVSDRTKCSFSYAELINRSGVSSPEHIFAVLSKLEERGYIKNVSITNGYVTRCELRLNAYHYKEIERRLKKEDIRYWITTAIAVAALLRTFIP